MLIDSGSAGAAGDRDSKRIAAAMQAAGLTKIDYLFTTHYDSNHFGGAPNANNVAHFRPLLRSRRDRLQMGAE